MHGCQARVNSFEVRLIFPHGSSSFQTFTLFSQLAANFHPISSSFFSFLIFCHNCGQHLWSVKQLSGLLKSCADVEHELNLERLLHWLWLVHIKNVLLQQHEKAHKIWFERFSFIAPRVFLFATRNLFTTSKRFSGRLFQKFSCFFLLTLFEYLKDKLAYISNLQNIQLAAIFDIGKVLSHSSLPKCFTLTVIGWFNQFLIFPNPCMTGLI